MATPTLADLASASDDGSSSSGVRKKHEVKMTPERASKNNAVLNDINDAADEYGYDIQRDPTGNVVRDDKGKVQLNLKDGGFSPVLSERAYRAAKNSVERDKELKQKKGELTDVHPLDAIRGAFNSAKDALSGSDTSTDFPEFDVNNPRDAADLNSARKAKELYLKRISNTGLESKKAESTEKSTSEIPFEYYFASKNAPQAVKDAIVERHAKRFDRAVGNLDAHSATKDARDFAGQIAQDLRGVHDGKPSATRLARQFADNEQSPTIKRAIQTGAEAISQNDHQTPTGIWDALTTGAANNVAPTTIGAGALLAKGIGNLVGSDADVTKQSTSQNIDQVHQAIVKGLTGKNPEEQATYIQQLKEEHPIAYGIGSALGWIADPVGILTGKAAGAAGDAVASAGVPLVSKVAKPLASAADAVTQGRLQGSDNDAVNAGAGLAGHAIGNFFGNRIDPALATERQGVRDATDAISQKHVASMRESPQWKSAYQEALNHFPPEINAQGIKDSTKQVKNAIEIADRTAAHGGGMGGAISHHFQTLRREEVAPGSVPRPQLNAALIDTALEIPSPMGLRALASLKVYYLRKGAALTAKSIDNLVIGLKSRSPKMADIIHDSVRNGVPQSVITGVIQAFKKNTPFVDDGAQ